MLNYRKLFKSFKCALRGLLHAIKSEQSFRLQLIIAFVVIVMAVYFRVPAIKALVLGVTIIIVLSFELVNTMAERIIDLVEPSYQDRVRDIKDVLAAAVLLAAIGSIVIGLIIFLPYCLQLLQFFEL